MSSTTGHRPIPRVVLLACIAWTSWAWAADAPVHYLISLANPGDHLVQVRIDLPPGAAERDLQLPVWNALYQVRDFSQFVNGVKARSPAGQPLAVRALDKSLWRISGTEAGSSVEYVIYADQSGPYNAQLNRQHGFFNLAEILMYPVDARTAALTVKFSNLPAGWRIATTLPPTGPDEFSAPNYDRLVDSPVELGTFAESDFDEAGGHYRVVVDADFNDYDMQKVVSVVRKLVIAGTAWMDDRPFATYMFIYHFPQAGAGGGMEHSDCTAIDVNAQVLEETPLALADVTAHEFFHLWNVKRIRPQSLEPVDYTRENYTDALWFSEGVTNTVQNYLLLRAGLIDEGLYLRRLGDAIATLELRPAHRTQSAEESSLDAWLEKYGYYRLPQRSISYYNKGEVLGALLDLAMRDASNNATSLRDLFQWMNRNYAQQGRFFADSEGVRQAAEALSQSDLKPFFDNYVAGTSEIPWDDYFRSVGLHLVQRNVETGEPGFTAVRSFGNPPTVAIVASGSEADRVGLLAGDIILTINGHTAGPDFQAQLDRLRPRETLHVRVRSNRGDHDLHWKLGSREEVEFLLKDVDNISPQQKARRAAWLKGETQRPGDTHP